MVFPLPLAIAIYATIWWIVLFAVLPLGVRSAEETGEAQSEGSDPGAPIAPQLAKKAGLTTMISAIVFAFVSMATKFFYG
jgi:predicted secreted protein